MDHILYQIFKNIMNIFKTKHKEEIVNPLIIIQRKISLLHPGRIYGH